LGAFVTILSSNALSLRRGGGEGLTLCESVISDDSLAALEGMGHKFDPSQYDLGRFSDGIVEGVPRRPKEFKERPPVDERLRSRFK